MTHSNIKLAGALLGMTMLVSACASNPVARTEGRLELYRAHAGAPVNSFLMRGALMQWTSLGDSALAVWISPKQAYLLELDARCPDLDFAQAIQLGDARLGQISARFDNVIPLRMGGYPHDMRIPCRINTIRPLDVAALRAAERAATAQPPSGT